MPEKLYYDGEVEESKEFCRCGSLTKCISVHNHTRHSEVSDVYSIEIVKILECLTCERLTVVLYSGRGDNIEDEVASENKPRKYIRRELLAPKRRYDKAIPQSIDDVMNQAEAVLANSPRASFILCRAVLEEICANFNIPKEKRVPRGSFNS